MISTGNHLKSDWWTCHLNDVHEKVHYIVIKVYVRVISQLNQVMEPPNHWERTFLSFLCEPCVSRVAEFPRLPL